MSTFIYYIFPIDYHNNIGFFHHLDKNNYARKYSYCCVGYLSNPGTRQKNCHLSAKAYSCALKCNIDSTIAFLNLLFGKQTQKISLNACLLS